MLLYNEDLTRSQSQTKVGSTNRMIERWMSLYQMIAQAAHRAVSEKNPRKWDTASNRRARF